MHNFPYLVMENWIFVLERGNVMPENHVVPPYSNTGAQNTYRSDLRALVDWLGFTLPCNKSVTEIIRFLGFRIDDFHRAKTGRYGYPEAYRFGHISIYYGAREEMGVHVEFSGQGCREFETYSSITWKELFKWLIEEKAKVSRLDVSIDDFRPYFKLETIRQKISRVHVRSYFKDAIHMEKVRLKDGASKGITIYFGSPTSSIQIRMYEKNHERVNNAYLLEDGVKAWNRTEIQLRDERALTMMIMIAHTDHNLGYLVSGVLKHYISFLVPSKDTNKARWKICRFWKDFLGDCERIKLSTQAPGSDD